MALLITKTGIEANQLEAGDLHQEISDSGVITTVNRLEHDPISKDLRIYGDVINDSGELDNIINKHVSGTTSSLNLKQYIGRSEARSIQLHKATIELVDYYMVNSGDTEEQANAKVTSASTEVALTLYPYVIGNKQPLIDAINASSLPHMDANAKAFLIASLEYTLTLTV